MLLNSVVLNSSGVSRSCTSQDSLLDLTPILTGDMYSAQFPWRTLGLGLVLRRPLSLKLRAKTWANTILSRAIWIGSFLQTRTKTWLRGALALPIVQTY